LTAQAKGDILSLGVRRVFCAVLKEKYLASYLKSGENIGRLRTYI
jgi:hypothetical protein